jgi:hypothetical protein
MRLRELSADREGHRDGGRGMLAARQPRDAPVPAPIAALGNRSADHLRGFQFQRLAETLQGSLGNRRVAALLTAVQRAPGGPVPSDPRPAPRSTEVEIRRISARVNVEPRFLAREVEMVSRGDHLTLSGERRGGWHRVVTPEGRSGWLHESAWLTPKVRLSSAPGAGGGSEPREEVEIGGRG